MQRSHVLLTATMETDSLSSVLKWYRYFGINPSSDLVKATLLLIATILLTWDIYNILSKSSVLVVLIRIGGSLLVLFSTLKPSQLIFAIECTLRHVKLLLGEVFQVKPAFVKRLGLKVVVFNACLLALLALESWMFFREDQPVSSILANILCQVLYFTNLVLQITLLQYTKDMLNGVQKACQKLERFDLLSKLHWHLCDVVRKYNVLYGPLMLVETIFVCIVILANLQFYLVAKPQWDTVLLWAPNDLQRIVLLLLHGFKVYDLSNCFDRLSSKVDGYLHSLKGKERLESSLEKFSFQCKSNPKITALGFFAMDNTMVVTLFGILSTFVILIVQYA